MRLAHILPPKVIEKALYEIGDYHLLLPALFPDKFYRDFYTAMTVDGSSEPHYKILDNGEAEGEQRDFDMLVTMAQRLKVDELILPDVIGNADATLERVARVGHLVYGINLRYMFVVQGKTVNEMITCAERAVNQFGQGLITAFGIPRHILSGTRDETARAQIAGDIHHMYPNRDIHLLGTSIDYPFELLKYGKTFGKIGVRGVDTSLAWNATLQEIDLSSLKGSQSLNYNLKIKRQPIEDFFRASFDHADPRYVELLKKNMETMNSWMV